MKRRFFFIAHFCTRSFHIIECICEQFVHLKNIHLFKSYYYYSTITHSNKKNDNSVKKKRIFTPQVHERFTSHSLIFFFFVSIGIMFLLFAHTQMYATLFFLSDYYCLSHKIKTTWDGHFISYYFSTHLSRSLMSFGKQKQHFIYSIHTYLCCVSFTLSLSMFATKWKQQISSKKDGTKERKRKNNFSFYDFVISWLT